MIKIYYSRRATITIAESIYVKASLLPRIIKNLTKKGYVYLGC